MTSPPRILHVANHIDETIGGSIFATFQIAQCAAAAGCECEVVATVDPSHDRTEYFQKRFPEIRIHGFPFHFPRRNHASWPLFQWLRRHWDDYDIIHCHQIFHWPFIFCGMLAGKRRAPLVISPHNSLDPSDLKKRAALKACFYGPWIIRPTLGAAHSLLCTAGQEANDAVDFGARPAPLRRHLPLAVPLLDTPNGGFRSRFGISGSAFVILFLSRLDVKKNIPMLIRAFAEILKENPDAVLAIAGTGDKTVETECRSLCDRMQLQSHVRWCGFLSGADKSAAYFESDLFVLPSIYENFAMVLVEAMYAGLPVITTTGVYIQQELNAAGAARICAPEPDELLQAIRELHGNAEVRARYADCGRAFAKANYLPETAGQGYRDFYERILHDAPRHE